MPLPGQNTQADPPRYTDAGQYMYHRHLQPVTGETPLRVRVASDKGGVDEADVTQWLGKQLPPHVAGFQKGFFDHYMDPTEVYARFDQLAAQFPDIAEQVPLPNPTSGYQRKASTVVGTTNFTTPARPATFTGRRRRAGRDARVARDGPRGRQPAHRPARQPRRPERARSRCR